LVVATAEEAMDDALSEEPSFLAVDVEDEVNLR